MLDDLEVIAHGGANGSSHAAGPRPSEQALAGEDANGFVMFEDWKIFLPARDEQRQRRRQ